MTVTTRQSTVRTAAGLDGAFVQTVTPEMAQNYLQDTPYSKQRPLRQSHVSFLAQEMERGNFIQRTALHLAYLGGEAHLVDGQHRLSAVVKSGLSQTFTITRSVVNSADELAWLYTHLDRGMVRTFHDLTSAMDVAEKTGLSQREVNYLGSAILFMESGCIGSKGKVNERESLERINLYAPYARTFFDLAEGAEVRLRRASARASTLSLALLTLRHSTSYAVKKGAPAPADFWRGAIYDDGIPAHDGRKFANRHLLLAVMYGGGKDRTMMTPASAVRYLASCFNAYMAGEERRFIRAVDEKSALSVCGVPRDPTMWW